MTIEDIDGYDLLLAEADGHFRLDTIPLHAVKDVLRVALEGDAYAQRLYCAILGWTDAVNQRERARFACCDADIKTSPRGLVLAVVAPSAGWKDAPAACFAICGVCAPALEMVETKSLEAAGSAFPGLTDFGETSFPGEQ